VSIPTALLRQTVTVETYTGESATGPLFDPEIATYPGRIRPSRRWVSSASGDAVLGDAVLDLRPEAVIDVGDRVTAEGEVYRVVAVAEQRGLTRSEYLEATLSRSET